MTNEQTYTGPRSWRSWLLNALIAFLTGVIVFQAYDIFAGNEQHEIIRAKPLHDSTRVNDGIQIDILNGCGAKGVGQTVTDFTRSLGYDVVEMKNYKNSNQDKSLVIDRSGKTDAVRELAEHLGIDPANIVQEISRDYFVTATIVIGKDYGRLRPWNNQQQE